MTVICEITDYSNDEFGNDEETVKIYSTEFDGDKVKIVFNNQSCKVSAKELISAVKRATLDCFGN